MALTSVGMFFAACVLSQAKVYNPCELSESLVQHYGYQVQDAGNWICLAKFTSGLNAGAVDGPFDDGTYSYGIFQINEKYCRGGAKSECGVTCSALKDLANNARCALMIYNEEGFTAWPAWENDCKGKDVNRYVSRCNLRG